MQKLTVIATVLITGLLSGFTATAQAATESCIPSFLKANKKYYIETGSEELKVKIMEITADSCWVYVKEVLPVGVDEKKVTDKKKDKFWINFNHVSVIRNKA